MKGIKCKNCKNLVNDWCDVKCDSPDPAIVRDCVGFEPFTNGDRIRAMTDEELAGFFGVQSVCGYIQDNYYELCETRGVCNGCILHWLKQPCEVDHDTD